MTIEQLDFMHTRPVGSCFTLEDAKKIVEDFEKNPDVQEINYEDDLYRRFTVTRK